jgi:anti-anti-sigma factor
MTATFTVQPHGTQTGVIFVHGDLTGAAEADLMQAFSQAVDAGAKNLVLDFSDMPFMNSTGIGLLVTLLVRANRTGIRLAACGLSTHYREIFMLTRLEEAFQIFSNVEEALAAA